MTATDDFRNPLFINLHRQTKVLLSTVPISSKYATDLLSAKSNIDLLNTLSRLLTLPSLTISIAKLFRPILFDLCARWLENPQNSEEQFVALCLMLENHEELFPILYRIITSPMFNEGPLVAVFGPSFSPDVSRLQRLLLAYYRLLRANRELPILLLWPLSPLSQLIWNSDLCNGTRLLAILCYALQSGMGEAEREAMEKEVLGEQYSVDCEMEYGSNIDGSIEQVDGWIMPVVELQRIRGFRQAIAHEDHGYYTYDEGEHSTPLKPSELSAHIVDAHGVFLLRSTNVPRISKSIIVPTPTTTKALQSLALHLSLRLPTLLTSPPSSGKSLFLTHLADLIHPGVGTQIVTIHLADTSLDPRALLGSYVSSPMQSGAFEWKEGVLVRAMQEGKWVVFKDIDRGSNEVLGVIKPLVESLQLGKWIGGRASLEVPSRGRVIAADSFALFATRSIQPLRNGLSTPPTFFGAHKFHELLISSPSGEELCTILDSRFPRLAGNANIALMRLWESIRSLGSAASTRHVGLRELEKFCLRVEMLLPSSYQPMNIDLDETSTSSLTSIFTNPVLREDIYLEARDVFFGAGALTSSAQALSEAFADTIANHLGLEPDRRDWVLSGRTPDLDILKDVNGNITVVRIGHTLLPAYPAKTSVVPPTLRPFALHKPAISLLSRIGKAVSLAEPVLLTGETGTGKTSIVTYLASLLRRPLISLNLSHQTESSDLLGGFKPVDARIPGAGLQQRFLDLFGGTFSRRKNEKFETEVRKAVANAKWKRAVGLWKESSRLAKERIQSKGNEEHMDNPKAETPRKRRKVELNVSADSWDSFIHDVEEFDSQFVQGKGKFAFSFIEGPLIKALRSGAWILLDEINLASPETLECITGLLHSPTASITLTEQGSLEPVPRHPDFRLFACMNPATDVGKKDLPANIRSRFTEIDVPPPDTDRDTLLSIINQYIGAHAVSDKGAVMNVAEFYIAVKDLAEKRQIVDGSSHRPHYSMRTLARALTFASDIISTFTLRRAIWEGCLMAFTMVLDEPSAELVTVLAQKHLLAGVRNVKSMLTKEPQVPHSHSIDEYVKFGPFLLEKGPLAEDPVEDYVMTPSVETKLINLARIILTRKFPILIEGPTSSGKTSSVEYLAKRTGHRFVRINNHEHTDIQEYIGSYVSDPQTGKLVFKDGLLVRALRNGDWVVLDELNLAPTDVLEALNRLLDDNRELVIPETQEVIKPHSHFMLFAAQNPPGLYAGRKVLSRAFRNRFLEVHFDDVPQIELETILYQRCRIAPSYAKRIVNVFHELQKRRQSSRVFESKEGFATLRDLFRWAGRDAVGYQELAENGYMLLAERARRDDDKAVVKEVIESIMNVKIDEHTMYDIHRTGIDTLPYLGCSIPTTPDVIWTSAMQRLFVLVSRALRFNEPVLLVGETGAGKTSVCQTYADATSKRLLGVNCHQNTETADLIGGLRPVRNRRAKEAEILKDASELLREIGSFDLPRSFEDLDSILKSTLKLGSLPTEHQSCIKSLQARLHHLQSIFEWHDGPLIEAMRNGDVFLLDEISLADDSVLERLNSVLEPGRTIVLAEKGGGDEFIYPDIQASSNFSLVATMNPGGDYGKKELSPALRNRFTEVWVPRVESRQDLELIVSNLWTHDDLKPYTAPLLDFVEWLYSRVGDHSVVGLRDILAWVNFSNAMHHPDQDGCPSTNSLFHHAAHMTLLDGLSSLPQLSAFTKESLRQLRSDALSKLMDIAPSPDVGASFSPSKPSTSIQIGPFSILKGDGETTAQLFNFQAPTTQSNAVRIIRACQVPKPILLEGSPGVGKTSLVSALANICGYELCRINLSDQTDLVDLFGSDLPVEKGGLKEFAWKDAEFLRALQEGRWVLLDEMNLAPQAVLEGLNAVLDHRGTVYIPELGRSFTRHPAFRIFAAQNPLNQGGGRKGLPKSFVNRFTKVYIEELTSSDLLVVCQHIFPELDESMLRRMISYTIQLQEATSTQRNLGRDGGPWEFNLRDIVRWGRLVRAAEPPLYPSSYLRSVYLHRFRNDQDRRQACSLYNKVFSTSIDLPDDAVHISLTPKHLQVGLFVTQRRNVVSSSTPGRILKMQTPVLESLGHCISQSWLAILTGRPDSGKTNVVRLLAHLTGNTLQKISVNGSTDIMDILGGFEQVDLRGSAWRLIDDVISVFDDQFRSTVGSKLDSSPVHKLKKAREAGFTLQQLLRLTSGCIADLLAYSPAAVALQGEAGRLLDALNTTGRFEWVDGPLVQAMKHGHWVLMDGANLCSPSVLDRLNSLCEENGVLTLSERGYVGGNMEILKPHPDFRLFMTVDPQYGELSRAMRNRGIEISLLFIPTSDDHQVLRDFRRLPLASSPIVDDCKASCLLFEGARRGLSGLGNIVPSPIIATSGCALDQQSILSSLTDQGPMIVTSFVASSKLTDAHLFFAARTTPPSSLNVLDRSLSRFHRNSATKNADRVRSLMNTFSTSYFTKALVRLRTTLSLSETLSSDLVFSQPMDICLTAPPCTNKRLEHEAVSSAHDNFLQALDLSVALFLDVEDQVSIKSVTRHDHTPKESHIAEKVSLVLSAIHITSRITFEALASGTPNLHDLRLSSLLLSYGRHLRRVITSVPLGFSALHATCQWIIDAVRDSSSSFSHITDQAIALRDAISPTTGLGLIEIWRSLTPDSSLGGLSADNEVMHHLSTHFKDKEAQKLQRQAFNLIALQSMSTTMTKENAAILFALRKEMESHSQAQNEWEEQAVKVDPPTLIAELGIFCSTKDLQSSTNIFLELLDIACDGNGGLHRLMTYQHLIWTRQAGHRTNAILAKIQIQWLSALWDTSSHYDLPNGPAVLLRPTQLMATLSICDWTHKPLFLLEDYTAELNRYSRVLLLKTEKDTQRILELANLLFQSIVLIADCFADSFPHAVYDAMYHLSAGSAKELGSSADKLLELLSHSDNPSLQSTVERYLRLPLERFQGNDSGVLSAVDLGFCWLQLGMLTMDLFVPDVPLDPAAIQTYTTERWREEKELIQAQLGLHQSWEAIMTGSTHSDLIGHLKFMLDDISSKLSGTPSYPLRTDTSRLKMFWSEVNQFRNQVLPQSTLYKLVESLQSGNRDAILQEEVLQKSMDGFCQRLNAVYVDYSDLSRPTLLAIHYVRMGLRFITHWAFENTAALKSHMPILVSFPTAHSSAAICVEDETTAQGVNTLLLTLSAVSSEWSMGIFPMDILETTYRKLFGLWLIDRAKGHEADKAASSLYRHKDIDYDGMREAELEEHEFLSMFPSFEDVLEVENEVSTENSSPASTLVSPAAMSQLVSLHHTFFGTSHGPSGITQFKETRKLVLASLIHSSASSLPGTLDDESLPFQLGILHDRLRRLEGKECTSGRTHNFYADSNIPEVKKAALVVIALKDRLDKILEQWPDQMVLHHLKSRCNVVLALDLHSPLAKVLSALEQLLLQTQDWEMYANRENTLKASQQSLTELIVEWRRLELSCWRGLLNSQLKLSAQGVNEWWFRLYDVTLQGPLHASEEASESTGGLEQYLNSLVPLLDDFIRTSSLGEFDTRIGLLQSFEAFVQCICNHKTGEQQRVLDRVRRILHSTICYYGMFSVQIRSYLNDQHDTLEKEVLGLIKLASWKDINVQALKASAQRSHHHLYKIIRKFRDTLKLPILDRLKVMTVDSLETAPDFLSPQSAPMNQPDGDHLLDPPKVFKKFEALVATRIRPFIYSNSANFVDGLAEDIIMTTKDLSEISVPVSLPAEQQRKQQKALLVRKRKAWSDLLKELKRVGFSAGLKPDTLRQNADSRWLREQPIIPDSDEYMPLTWKTDRYFARLYGSLPDLRSSLSNHHQDLTTRELQRGIMFLESAFSMGIELRSRLSTALEKYCELERIVKRLNMLISHPTGLMTGGNLLDHVQSVANVLARLTSALEETIDGVHTHIALNPKNAPPDTLKEEVAAAKHLTDALRRRFAVVMENMKLTSPPILLESENNIVLEAFSLFSKISDKLRNWAQSNYRLKYLFNPVDAWLVEQITPPLLLKQDTLTSDETIGNLTNAFLITVQDFLTKCPEVILKSEDGGNDRYVSQGFRNICDLTHLLNIELIMSYLRDAFVKIVTQPGNREQNLQRILPFVGSYLALVKDQLRAHSQWTKAIFKLCFVLCSVMSNLSTQGFCQPHDAQEGDETGDIGESGGGVGLGEGTGTTDVSKEIEDESQVEGLKGEESHNQEESRRDGKDDDDAIEMSEDFGGELEDVSKSGSEDDTNSGDESDDERDEQIGNLDASDPSAVDEKLWGDEEGPKDEKQDEKADQDHSKKDSKESEVVAKEGQSKNQSKEKEDTSKESNEENLSDTGDEIQAAADEPDEAYSADPGGAPMDEFVQDADTLDLPDDMDLEGKDAEKESEDISEDMKDEADEIEENMEGVEPEQEEPDVSTEKWEREDHYAHDTDEPADQEADIPRQPQEVKGDEEKSPEDQNEDKREEAVARPDISAGDGTLPPQGDQQPEVDDSADSGQVGGTRGVNGENLASAEDGHQGQNNSSKMDQTPAADTETSETSAAGNASSRTREGRAPAQPDSQSLTDPLRSRGDALKEIRQRFDDIISGEQQHAPQEKHGDVDAPAQVEYLQPDDEDHDMEALGPAGEERVAKLNELKLIDGDEQPAEIAPMDVDFLPESKGQDELPERPPRPEPTSSEWRDGIKNVVPSGPGTKLDQPSIERSTRNVDLDKENVPEDIVEMELRDWQTHGFPDAGIEKIWRMYESLTHDLAYALCEQLRLILEPTLATRLKGDYRTGKRLNMKKIIPYIASDYTKDKIWLRRTKPSQREYQVLIAIDDSRSMAESHSVHLAYQTLALVSKALSRLEAGDIAIAKFGESVEILRGFDEGPFTDQSGIGVMNAFRFNQKATNVYSLLQTSLKVLETARERRSMSSASAADLWQLQFIISDGMCQDHDLLRTLLRRAEEQRVMVVFVIVDSLHSTSEAVPGSHDGSILTMDKAEFKNVGGRMELQLRRYLDSFPFEYYVVLRNVEALPEVLASTLKQFFERISNM